MTKKITLNATAASLLGFLHDEPMTGWDLARVADERIGNFWNLTKSQVYRELQTLADTGMVASGERGARDKRTFSITPAGRKVFSEWLLQEPAEEIIRFPLLLTTSFADRLPSGKLHEFISQHRAAHETRLKEYRQHHAHLLKTDIPPTNGQVMTFAFGIRYEEMVLAWMDDISKTSDSE